MKTRNGFVSNSSSASFIIVWGPKIADPDNNFVKSICEVIDFPDLYDLEKKCIDLTKIDGCGHLMDEAYDIASYIIEHTAIKQIGVDAQYKTTSFTSMMNSFADFPDAIAKFVLALLGNSEKYRIYYAGIEQDE